MADNEIPILVTADTDQAKEQLERAGESVQMLADLIGINVPEGVGKMLAASELIGPALDAAFVPLVVITLGEAIFNLTEKIKQQAEELEKAKTETLNEALAVNQYAAALQASTLKLQDQLAVLQKKPPANGIKIAMEEGRKATSDLVDEFTRAIDKLNELLQKQKQGFWDRLINGDNGSNDVIAKPRSLKPKLMISRNRWIQPPRWVTRKKLMITKRSWIKSRKNSAITLLNNRKLLRPESPL